MSGRKRKQLNDDDESVDCPSSSAEDCPPAIENITVVVQPEPQKGKGKGTKEVTFRVHYKVEFTKPCCSNHKNTTRLTISSPKSCFEDGADPAILMMNKTIDKIKQHKCLERDRWMASVRIQRAAHPCQPCEKNCTTSVISSFSRTRWPRLWSYRGLVSKEPSPWDEKGHSCWLFGSHGVANGQAYLSSQPRFFWTSQQASIFS